MLYGEIIEKLLGEVDPDIREIMFREEKSGDTTYKGYHLTDNPALSILMWQAMRDRIKDRLATNVDSAIRAKVSNEAIDDMIKKTLGMNGVQEYRASGCPPHELVDYVYEGAWSASVPPPNKICTKCLMTTRV